MVYKFLLDNSYVFSGTAMKYSIKYRKILYIDRLSMKIAISFLNTIQTL